MSNESVFETSLIEAAEAVDKAGHPAQLKLLKQSYDFFKDIGLSDDAIKSAMALTSHQLRQLK